MSDRPSCPECQSNNVYVRVGGELVCRRCGYIGDREEESERDKEGEDEEFLGIEIEEDEEAENSEPEEEIEEVMIFETE